MGEAPAQNAILGRKKIWLRLNVESKKWIMDINFD
jgi:hypothetical protein